MADKIIVIEDQGYDGYTYNIYDSLLEALDANKYSDKVNFVAKIGYEINWPKAVERADMIADNIRQAALFKLTDEEKRVLGV